MTDKVVTKTFVNDLDSEDEANGTNLTNKCITETAGLQTAKDGEEEKSATNNNSTGTTETVGFQTQKDRVNEESSSNPCNTGMTATEGLEKINDKVNEESSSNPCNTGMTATEGLEKINDKGIEELGAETMLLKNLLGDLHKTIIEAKGNPIKKPCTIKPDTPFYVQHRQIQEIYNNFKEMESEMESADRQLFHTFSLVGDGLELKVVTNGSAKRTVEDQPDKHNENFLRTISALEKMKQTHQDIKQLQDDNKWLEFLLSCLHKYVTTSTEAIDTSFELPSGIRPDSPVTSSYKDSQDISKKFVTMKGDIKRFEDENRCLKSLLSCLHAHISTGTEANRVSFELPSEIPPDSAVASSYKEAQAIWNKFIKMIRSKEKNKNKNNKLLMSVEDMDRSLSREKETVTKLRNRITIGSMTSLSSATTLHLKRR